MPLAVAPGWELGDQYTLLLLAAGASVLLGMLWITHRDRHGISPSVAYLALGAIGAAGLSLLDVSPLDPEADHYALERVTELALIVAVFSAGLTIERHVRRRSLVSIAILLAVVMPLTILAIAAFGAGVMGLSFGGALMLGAVLAPTDPVLAGDVGLEGPGGAVLGEPRLSLHTEAGFNDGLASPFVVLAIFAAGRGGTDWIGQWLLADLLYGAGFALLAGAAAGFAAAMALTTAEHRRIIDRNLDGVLIAGLAVMIYGATEALGAYGLLAVFAAGFTFRRYEYDHEIHHAAHHGAETVGKTLEFLVLLALGTMLTTEGLGAPGLEGWLLVPLLLVLIRPVLVVATAGRSFIDRRQQLFLGFFGVRGVATLFYAAVAVDAHVLSPHEQHVVVWTTIAVVVSSIVVHGLTATPLTRRWLERASA